MSGHFLRIQFGGMILLGLLCLLPSCDEMMIDGSPYLEVLPHHSEVSVGETQLFTAEIHRKGRSEPAEGVYWSSTDSTVAVVSEIGLARGLKAGEATIWASTYLGLGDSATMVVRDLRPSLR